MSRDSNMQRPRARSGAGSVAVALLCLAACNAEGASQTKTLIVLARDRAPICNATLSSISGDAKLPVPAVASCRAVYLVVVPPDGLKVEVQADGFVTQRVALAAPKQEDANPNVESCALIWLDRTGP